MGLKGKPLESENSFLILSFCQVSCLILLRAWTNRSCGGRRFCPSTAQEQIRNGITKEPVAQCQACCLRFRVCVQYGCLHRAGVLFSEDTLIKELLYWKKAKCFFFESRPSTGGTEENVCTHVESSFCWINVTISRGSSETSTEVFTKVWTAPHSAWGYPGKRSFFALSLHSLCLYFLMRSVPQHTSSMEITSYLEIIR